MHVSLEHGPPASAVTFGMARRRTLTLSNSLDQGKRLGHQPCTAVA